MVKVVWAPSAIKDINAIADYIAKDSPQAAKNMVELFFEKIKQLEKFPYLGKPVPETKLNFLREILASRYRIIYEIHNESEVNILSVHHQSRLLKNNPTFKRRLRK